MQLNKQTENFQIEEKDGKLSFSISYELQLINKNEVNIKSEIRFYDDVTQILNTILILGAEGKDLNRKC